MKKTSLPSYSAPVPGSIPTPETLEKYEAPCVQKDDLLPLGRHLEQVFDGLIRTAKQANVAEVREKAGEMVALIVGRIVRHGGNLKATLLPEVYELHRHNNGYKKKWDAGGRQGTRQEAPQNKALREFVSDVLDEVLPIDFISSGADALLGQRSARKGATGIDARLRKFTDWVEPKLGQIGELRSSYKRTSLAGSRLSIRREVICEIRAACVLNADDFFEVFITPKARKMFSSNETHPIPNNFKLAQNTSFRNAKTPMSWSKNLRVMKRLLKELLGPI